MALSVGLSIVLVSLIGFCLNYSPFGIKVESVLVSFVVFNLALSAIGIRRRSLSEEPFLPFNVRNKWKSLIDKFHSAEKIDRAIYVVLVLIIAAILVTLVFIAAVPKGSEHFSEFYVLGPEGQAADYSNNLTVDQSSTVYLGIVNHEYRTVNYTVEVWLANETYIDNDTVIHELRYLDHFSIVLANVPIVINGNWTQEWVQSYNFSVATVGVYKIWFVLQLDGTPFQGVKDQDYAGTSVQDRFTSMVNSKDFYSLNLNLDVHV